MKEYIVVGCGIVGSVIARELADAGAMVRIYERRDHIAGNLYDYKDEYGIHVHRYGPHIFHTNIERVWNYVNRFEEFKDFNLICGSVIEGKCVRTTFDFSSVDIFFPDDADLIKEHIQKCFQGQKTATILEMLECPDEYVRKYAKFLYEKDYAPYTAKQWGIAPEEVDSSIFKRVPILLTYGSKYFDDQYQAMPIHGYTEMISSILNHPNISVHLNTDALERLRIEDDILNAYDMPNRNATIVYTGPLDELFSYEYGRLSYRSLRFEWHHEDIDSYQEMPVVAYPQAEGYTRITEYKKLPLQDVAGTTYAVEYPLPYHPGEQVEPYYPVQTKESTELYQRYENRAKIIRNLFLCGRLAEFKYYNIDQAIDRALTVAEKIREDL